MKNDQLRFPRTQAVVDLSVIRSNFMKITEKTKQANPEACVIAVVKTDAYGHGAVQVSQAIADIPGLWGFAVATVEEGGELREAGISRPILVLGHVFGKDLKEAVKLGLRIPLYRTDTLLSLRDAADELGIPAFVHLAVDTGMTRIGVRPDGSGLEFASRASRTEGIVIEGVFTHFARADEQDKQAAAAQRDSFLGFVRRMREESGITVPVCGMANSAAILTMPETITDVARAGIILYGLNPSDEVPASLIGLKPALSWYASVVRVEEVPAGTPVSYGGTFVTGKRTRIATVSIGYGDGYPRALSGRGTVLIRGKRAPVLGRICMDQMMVDVTGIPEAEEDDAVVLIGRDGNEEITAEELGDLSGRFNYELVCMIGARVPRVYVRSGVD